jgi:hypothetical protein
MINARVQIPTPAETTQKGTKLCSGLADAVVAIERGFLSFLPQIVFPGCHAWPGWGYLGYCSTMDTRMSSQPGYFRLPHVFMYERGAAKNQTFSILLSQSFMHALPQQKNQHFEPPVTQSACPATP